MNFHNLINLLKFNFLTLFLIYSIFSINSSADILNDEGSFLSANTIEHHEELSMISALGEVEVINADEILRANELTYDLKNDTIFAKGNVSLKTKEGDMLYAESMQLQGDLKTGVIKNFSSVLSDGSRLSAAVINRNAEKGDSLEKVVYTKCKICEDNSDEYPIWQLRGLKSKRNIEEGRVEYNHVILDAYGIPILYVPKISHPDPTIKRSSGYLSPIFKNNSILGPTYFQPYYYVLSKSSDVTITPGLTFNEGPIISADYRKLRSKGSIFIKGSLTRGSMERTDGTESNKMRGHINIKAIERLDEEWIAGMNVIRASDATYLPRYGLEKKRYGNLTQRAHLSGQSDGFYSEIESLYFQPMDSSKSNRQVPLILPNIKTIWTKHYEEGSYREIALNATSIARASGSNSQRVTLQSKWVKGTILESGHLLEASLSGRADLYRDRKTDRSKTSGDLGSHKDARFIPKLEAIWRLPSKGDFLNKPILFEPIIQSIVAPRGGNPNSIINNDSMDIELSHANIFSSERFTGLDRVESGIRVNFGFKSSIDLNDYGVIDALIGRTWRPDTPQKDFIKGTGLDEKFSNVVGNIKYNISNTLKFDYSFSKDSLDLRSQRDTFSLDINMDPFFSNLNYTMVRDDPNPSSNVPSNSEQALVSINWNISDNWSTNLTQSRDLVGTNHGDAIFSKASIQYLNECIKINISAERNHRDMIDVPDATTFSITFELVGF